MGRDLKEEIRERRERKEKEKDKSFHQGKSKLSKFNILKFMAKDLPIFEDDFIKNQFKWMSELDEDDIEDFEERLLRKAYREITEPDKSFKPYPKEEELFKEGFNFGKIKNSNIPFLIEKRFLGEHGIIYGRSGGGKTTRLLNPLLAQTLKDSSIRNFVFNVEKREDFVPFIREFPENLIWIDCSKTFPFNFLKPPEGSDLFGYYSDFLELLSGIFWIGILGRNFLIKTLKRVVFENGILRGNKDNYPTFKEVLDKLKDSQKEIRNKGFSIIDQFNKLLTKLETLVYTLPKEAINEKTGLDVSKIIDKNVIWDLTALPLESTQLIISGLLLQTYYYKTLNSMDLMHLFVFDEAQTIFGIPEKASMSGEIAYEKYIRKVRSADIGLWFACQDVSKMNQSISNNVFTKICLSLSSGKDIDFIRKDMQLDWEAVKYFFTKAEDDEALIKLSGGKFKRPTIIKLEPIYFDKVSDEELKAHMEKWQDLLSSYFSKDAKEKNEDFYQAELTENLSPNASKYFQSIKERPFLNVSQRNKVFGFSTRYARTAVDELLKLDLIKGTKIQVKEKKKSALYWHLKDKYGGKFGSFEAYFWKHIGKLYYLSEESIKEVSEEKSVNGSTHTVDLFIETLKEKIWAWECTLHFDNLISNVEKCLRDNYSKIIVAVRSQELEKAKKIITSHSVGIDKIEIKLLTDFYKEEFILNE